MESSAPAEATDAEPTNPTPPAGVSSPEVPPAMAPTEPEPPQPRSVPPTGQSSPATPAMAPCSDCGTPNPVEFAFCGNCGARLKPAAQQTARRAPSRPAAPIPAATLSLIRPDGSEGGQHSLPTPETVIGRGSGTLFDSDSYLSPQHARFLLVDGQMVLEDAGSLNGVFVRSTQEEPLQDGTVFRIGQELLRFDVIYDPECLEDGTEVMGSPNPGYWGRLSIIVGPGIDGSAFPLMGEEIVLGREQGDILFSDDGYVSSTHARITIREDGYFLEDLGSSNGTFIKVTEPRVVTSGTFVLMGQQLFRADYR